MTIPPPSEPGESAIEVTQPVPDPVWHRRVRAILEIFLCSGIPTQLFAAQLLGLGGLQPYAASGQLEPSWVFLLALIDTTLVISIAVLLLRANGDSPRTVFLGPRAPLREAVLGVALI